jgi:hypothetical protein
VARRRVVAGAGEVLLRPGEEVEVVAVLCVCVCVCVCVYVQYNIYIQCNIV